MKAKTSFLKQCLAMALALVLLASCANLGALQVFAAGGETTVRIGKIVADNYDLSDAEKALLSSGNLPGGVYVYTTPGEEQITVDTDIKQIKATSYEGWIATQAKIVVDGSVVETVPIYGGLGTYTYTGNTFSVLVTYVLDFEVKAELQEQLLNSAGWLKQGVANLENAYVADTNLGTVVMAMDVLEDLADGISMSLGAGSIKAQFGEEAIAAVTTLSDEIQANGGQLDLQVMNAAYSSSASKTQYLLENGVAYKGTLKKTTEAVNAIVNDPLTNNSILDSYLQSVDPSGYTKWMAFKGIMKNLVNIMKPVAEADWTAAEKGTALVSAIVDYDALDVLVAALGTTTVPAVKNPLRVATADVQKNLNMYNVTVKVVLKTVEDKDDSAVLEIYGEAAPVVLTLNANTSKADILAAVAEKDIEAEALAAWPVYVAEHFEATATSLPDTLTADVEYTVTYAPKNYTVTTGYAGDMTVPYGYRYTLPKHTDPVKAYDYTVNSEKKAQGDVIVIEGNTTVERTSGKSYTSTDLYKIVSDNYGNDLAKEILQSGALKDNTIINYRKPDPADAESILKLLDGTLTADDYGADYQGLSWKPYTFGAVGNENNFSGNTAAWTGKEAKVVYKLTLDNFGQAKAQEILDLAVALKTEAEAQKSAMDSLAGMGDTLKLLDKTKLGALNGVIDVTDFTPGDGTDTDAENLEIRAELKSIVGAIIANNLDIDNYLKIYNIVEAYKIDGMSYYYKNYAVIKGEVNSLAGYMTNLMDNEEALIVMCNAAGFPEYADKIADVEGKLNEYNAKLSAPNAVIDVDSANLGKLITALTKSGNPESVATGAPYIMSETLTALDESSVMVQVLIETPKGNAAVTTDSMDRGTVMTLAQVETLKDKVNAAVADLLGANVKYYTLSVEGTALDALVGVAIDANVNTYYTYTTNKYVVKIDGEADQTINIDDLEINLPKHPTAGFRYDYTVDGVETTASTYTFTLDQIDNLFVGGIYTITRTETNEAQEKLEANFAEWIVKDGEGNIVGLNANVAGTQDGLMDFVMTLVNAGYTYIGLNNEPLIYMAQDDTLEICLQTLINAMLNDNTFGSQTLIDLGTNGNGKLLKASLQLGDTVAANEYVIYYNDLDFTLNMTSVPSQMGTVATGLDKIKPYMTFQSKDGIMNINLNLPEKVYEVYLAALLATGNIDEDNMDAINSEIAFQFLWDYIDLILNSEADTETYSNTLAMLGQNYDLTGYEDYYQLVKKALTNDGVVVNPATDGVFDMTVTAKSKSAIESLLDFAAIDVSAYETYLAMIKEYKYDDAELTAGAVANLVNTDNGFEAALLDLNAAGYANKFDFTKDLPARAASIADKAAVILLDDVDGNLVFNGTTILDLNGKTVKGSIVANGSVYIVDSSLDTANCGYVTGNVSGNATIIGGKYEDTVTAFLKDGYKQVGGVVQNALYTLESDGNDVTVVVNTDVMNDESVDGYIPNARALAVEIAVDLALNYYTSAALTADGNGIYDVDFDDLVALINSTSKADDLINKVLASINVPGMSDFTNVILADLMDFAAIAAAIESDSAVASYTLSTAPWAVIVEHKTEGDYITVGIGSNPELAESFQVSLKFTGDNKDRVVPLLKELGEIATVTATVDLEQPDYDEAANALRVVGSGAVDATFDLSKSDYAVIIAVILANGNPEAKDALIDAVNADDMEALKAAIDEMTVEDVFTALKVLSRNESFASIASKLGVTIDTADAAELEQLYHLILCAAGKVLEELDITGRSSKLGNLDADGDGVYELELSATRKPDASYRGYSVYAEASADVKLTVILFAEEDCLWGDANHDDKVNLDDATLILQYYVGTAPADFCTKRTDVNGDGEIALDDATLVIQYYAGIITSFPVEN